MPANSLLDLIGNTPLLEITHLPRGVCRLFVKLESQNPGGSIKDRIGLSMIEAAERDGKLKPAVPLWRPPPVTLASAWHWSLPRRATS